ncbi:MAG: AI-2E family transporter, partial [Prevotella sp.]|nr:AI-2E family transporter [Prevotella sp.]
MESKITLDKLVRWGGIALSVLIVYYLVKILSGVLLPFFIAWLLAYLLNPMVKFVQHKMRVRSRVVSIIITMIAVIAVVALVILLIIPPMIGQFQKLGEVAIKFLNSNTPTNNVTEYIQQWFRENQEQVNNFFKSNDFTEALKVAMPKLFAFVGETANVVISIIASFITLLYMFFILLDYEFLTNNWIKIFPKKSRPFWKELMGDVERELNNYIRGQGLVALC